MKLINKKNQTSFKIVGVMGAFLERKDLKLEFNEIRNFIFKNKQKIKALTIKAISFNCEELALGFIFEHFDYSSKELSVSNFNGEIVVKKGNIKIEFPLIFEHSSFFPFPFIEEEDIKLLKIISMIKKDFNIIEKSDYAKFYVDNEKLILANKNFVVRSNNNEIFEFKLNDNLVINSFEFNFFYSFELSLNFNISYRDFFFANMPNSKEFFYLKNNNEDKILSFKFDNHKKTITQIELMQNNAFKICYKMLKNLQKFVTNETSNKWLQNLICAIKNEIQKSNPNNLKKEYKNILNNIKELNI